MPGRNARDAIITYEQPGAVPDGGMSLLLPPMSGGGTPSGGAAAPPLSAGRARVASRPERKVDSLHRGFR